MEVNEADERAIRQLMRFGQLRGVGWRWMRQMRGRLGKVVDLFSGPAMIQFAMRPRYGKKSTLYKRRWVYIAGMRSFGPLKTIFW